MVTQKKRTFIYGRFVWPDKGKSRRLSPLYGEIYSSRDIDRIGIEILREFSATELVGKLYTMSGSPPSWLPIDVHTLRDEDWYRYYRTIPKPVRAKDLFSFDIEGSGPWAVLFIRTESDDAGPYVAIALKY